MKYSFLTALVLFLTSGNTFSQSDSITIDKQKINVIIQKIKDENERSRYGQFAEDYSVFDITFEYPEKIPAGNYPWINVKWKDEVILMYDLFPDYTIKTIIDLR